MPLNKGDGLFISPSEMVKMLQAERARSNYALKCDQHEYLEHLLLLVVHIVVDTRDVESTRDLDMRYLPHPEVTTFRHGLLMGNICIGYSRLSTHYRNRNHNMY
jgi:hypothetical protein